MYRTRGKWIWCASVLSISASSVLADPNDLRTELEQLRQEMIELRGAKEEVQALRSEVADLRANQDEA